MQTVEHIEPGFQTPAIEAQRVFRAVMEGWARPGQRVDVSGFGSHPEGIDPAAAAIALTLVDADTPIHLLESAKAANPWFKFHCGCPVTDHSGRAEFVFGTAEELTDLSQFSLGSAMEPELGARIIATVKGFESGPAYQFSGPGVNGVLSVQIDGLLEDFFDRRAKLSRRFPAGLDFVFVAGSQFLCLPRTTLIKREN